MAYSENLNQYNKQSDFRSFVCKSTSLDRGDVQTDKNHILAALRRTSLFKNIDTYQIL